MKTSVLALILFLISNDVDHTLKRRDPVEAAQRATSYDAKEILLIDSATLYCAITYADEHWWKKPFIVANQSKEWPSRVFLHHFRNPCLVWRDKQLKMRGLPRATTPHKP